MRPGPLTGNLAANELIISIFPGDMLALALAPAHLVAVGLATVDTALAGGAALRDTAVGA